MYHFFKRVLIECKIGYIGSNRSSQCRYPSYGKGCQHECSNCSKENCDARFGCLTPNVSIDTGSNCVKK